MLQQTQAARVEPMFRSFVRRFPTVASLAGASRADVLRAWAGLGYNRRAVHLHAAAQAVVLHHRGRVPTDVEALRSLPGVGPYTAAAVASIAGGAPVAALDVNVRRIVGRVGFGDEAAPRSSVDAAAARWVDRADNVGKSTGAFCASPYGVHPYILITWSNTMRNVFTLAHELGHGGHFALAMQHQRFVNMRPAMPFVEAPSIMNEMLLAQHILSKSQETRMRRSVIMQVLSFQLTGRRIFAMSPLHHHFELVGWKENTVIVRFWILSAVFALLGLATLKLR